MRISDWSSDVCSSDPPEADEYLIEYEGRAVPVARRPQMAEHLGVVKPHAARTLHQRLHQHGGNLSAMLLKRGIHGVRGQIDDELIGHHAAKRSEERRVGKECDSQGRSRWAPYH